MSRDNSRKPQVDASWQSSDLRYESKASLRGFLIAWVLIAIVHSSLFALVGVARFNVHSYREFSAVTAAIGASRGDAASRLGTPQSSTLSVWGLFAPFVEEVQDEVSYVLQLPLIPLLASPTSSTINYFELSIPLGLRVANSLLAAMLILLFGYAVTGNAMPRNIWRRFFGGEAALEPGNLPPGIEGMPIVRSVRFMKGAETSLVKRTFALAGIHYAMFFCTRMLELSESVAGESGFWTIAARLVRFPVSPLLVDFDAASTNHLNTKPLGFLMVGNSLVWGVVVSIVLLGVKRICSRRS